MAIQPNIQTSVVRLRRGGGWEIVPTHRTERFDYREVADAYVPHGVAVNEWGDGLGEFVVDQVSRISDLSNDEYRRYTRALARFMSRAATNGFQPDVELLTPSNIESFTASMEGADTTKATLRSDLDRLGRALTAKAPWEPPATRYSRASRLKPYTDEEIRAFHRDASQQPTRRKEMAARGMLALCAGAGVSSGELRGIVTDSIRTRSDGTVVVHVTGSRPRVVPVAEAVGEELLELAEMANGVWICGGRSAGKNYANMMSKAVLTRSGNPLLPARLRSTWIVRSLENKAPLTDLLHLAGMKLPGSLDDYIEHVNLGRNH